MDIKEVIKVEKIISKKLKPLAKPENKQIKDFYIILDNFKFIYEKISILEFISYVFFI